MLESNSAPLSAYRPSDARGAMSIRVPRFNSLKAAVDAMLDELEDWIDECMARYRDAPPVGTQPGEGDGHDQCTYMTSWWPAIELRGRLDALGFIHDHVFGLHKHYLEAGLWRDGYWKKHEAHHGTEHLELFVGSCLAKWSPELDHDLALGCAAEDIRELVQPVRNLIAGRLPGAPEWFDRKNGVFHSQWLGRDFVGDDPKWAINTPDHVRCVNVFCSPEPRSAHGETFERDVMLPWAEAILRHNGGRCSESRPGEHRMRSDDAPLRLPVALVAEGPLYELSGEREEAYRSICGEVAALESPLDAAENFLAAGGIQAFRFAVERGLLGTTSRDREPTNDWLADPCADAAQLLMQELMTALEDPDAGCVAGTWFRWRLNQTRAHQLGRRITAAVDASGWQLPEVLSILPFVHRDKRPRGIGKRSDMPVWLEDGEPRRAHPVTLATAAILREDEDLARDALALSLAMFRLAQQVYPSGRHHGCSARTVSAILRGHGRENHMGVVTAVLEPIIGKWG